MKKIFAFLLVFCVASTAFAGPRHHGHCPPPRVRRHSFVRPPVRHHHSHGCSMHTRDWIGLGAFILGTSIIANAVERQPTVVYHEPVPQTVYQVPMPAPAPTVATSSAPVVVIPPAPPLPPPIIPLQTQIYYHRTLSAPPYGVIVRPPMLIVK